MLLEFCAENFTKIPKAIDLGANRIELCDNLAVGGTTPSYAVIHQAVSYAHIHGATVVTMVRPRGGNFVYDAFEFDMMLKDLEIIKSLQSDGAVFGCLTEENRINRHQTKTLIEKSEGMETIFHMAFDQIPKTCQKEELDWLVEQGVTRILTRGGVEGSAFDHADWLKELIDYAGERIQILAGGGISHESVFSLAEQLGTDQFHGSKIVPFPLDESF